MSLFAIADLHLSLGEDKPMDVFSGWSNYVQRLEENWRRLHLDRMVTDILPLRDIDKAINMMINGDNLCKIIIDCQKI